MRHKLLIQSGKLEIISKILGIKKKTLQQKLWRAGMKIDDIEFIKELIIDLLGKHTT